MSSMGGRYAIVGVGEVAPPKGTPYESYYGMAAEVSDKALNDAGLTKKDIDGVVFTTAYGPPFPYPSSTTGYFCEYTGMGDVWFENYPYGSMPTGPSVVHRACMGIEAGMAKTVLVVNSDNWLTRNNRQSAIEVMASRAFDSQYEWPYGPYAMTIMGLMANRHMYEYGTTSAQLAEAAVAARKWALMNPVAFSYNSAPDITVEDVLNSREICTPLRRLDCCIVTDGGTAYVVTTADRAKDFKKPPVYIQGMGEMGHGRYITWVPDYADLDIAGKATKQAMDMADMTINDIDLAYLYDPATILTIIYLEQIGACPKGEGGRFVEGGRIRPGGEFPVNTHGGLLSCRHSAFAGASFQLSEAVKQLRQECGERQVKDAETALLLCEGGWFNIGVTVLSKSPR